MGTGGSADNALEALGYLCKDLPTHTDLDTGLLLQWSGSELKTRLFHNSDDDDDDVGDKLEEEDEQEATLYEEDGEDREVGKDRHTLATWSSQTQLSVTATPRSAKRQKRRIGF